MATKAMTQTQLFRHLAESCQLSNKVVRQFLETLAETALKETKKNGLFILPGIGRLGQVGTQGSQGKEPSYRRGHQDCSQDGGEVPGCQGRPGLHRSEQGEKEVISWFGPEALRRAAAVTGSPAAGGPGTECCALGRMGRCLSPGAAFPVAFPAFPFGFPLIISL